MRRSLVCVCRHELSLAVSKSCWQNDAPHHQLHEPIHQPVTGSIMSLSWPWSFIATPAAWTQRLSSVHGPPSDASDRFHDCDRTTKPDLYAAHGDKGRRKHKGSTYR